MKIATLLFGVFLGVSSFASDADKLENPEMPSGFGIFKDHPFPLAGAAFGVLTSVLPAVAGFHPVVGIWGWPPVGLVAGCVAEGAYPRIRNLYEQALPGHKWVTTSSAAASSATLGYLTYVGGLNLVMKFGRRLK